MLLHTLNKYFSALERASNQIDIIEGNLSVYEIMSNFKGTAKGSEQAAKKYIAKAKPKLVKLKRLLNEVKSER